MLGMCIWNHVLTMYPALLQANTPAVRAAVIRPAYGIMPATLQIPPPDSTATSPLIISGEPGRLLSSTPSYLMMYSHPHPTHTVCVTTKTAMICWSPFPAVWIAPVRVSCRQMVQEPGRWIYMRILQVHQITKLMPVSLPLQVHKEHLMLEACGAPRLLLGAADT